LIEQVLAQGSLVRVVTLTQIQVGGDDVLLGGAGDDAIHAGSGNDLINGGADEDALFAGDGDDAAWGGADHDRIFGGDGADSIDIKVRPGDPAIWSAVRPLEDEDGLRSTVNGQDLIYGGRGADVMQADMGDGGKRAGDRLSDWIGNNNLYFVCDSGYGAGQVLRAQSPGIKDALVGLARAVGADAPGTVGSSGHGELALLDKEKEPKASFAQGKGKGVCEAG
jgi:Ca2+-binding RTX toxin-like protein